MKVLVTGTAGFIGSHVAQVLLARGDTVIGFDSLNDYYDVTLKEARLARFIDHPNYIHVQADLADRAAVEQVFATHKPERVIKEAREPRLLQADVVVIVEAVEADDRVATRQQYLGDVRTDEAGGAGDEDFHALP